MATTPAAAQRPVRVDRDVAELAGHPIGSVEQPPVGHNRPADAGRHSHVDEVGLPASGAVRGFAERGHVRVAVEERGHAERAFDRVCQRDVVEVGAEIGWLDDDAGTRVHRTATRDADANDRFADLGRSAVEGGPDSRDARVHHRVRTELHGSLDRGAAQPGAVRLYDSSPDLGSTQVERKDRS
jgi:hypothetical protein